MLHLNVLLMFYFREHLKMYKNVRKKMHFILLLIIQLTVQSRNASEGTLEGEPNDALSNLHKDAHPHPGSTSNLMVHLSINMSVQLRVPLMIHLKAHLHLRFKLTVELHLNCT